MNREDTEKRRLERLERQRQIFNAHLDHQYRHLEKQRERLNAELDKRREKLEGKLTNKRDSIIAGALDLLDQDGINELSLRKLATKLHMQAPGLYWYFKNKEELIDYLAEAILDQAFHDLRPRQPDESWQDWLIEACKKLREAMHARRDGARIVAGAHLYPAVSLVRLYEAAGESLSSAGVDDRQADLIISTAVHFTFGRVIEEQSGPTPEQVEEFQLSEFLGQYPHMAASAQRTMADIKAGYDEFEDALRLIIHE